MQETVYHNREGIAPLQESQEKYQASDVNFNAQNPEKGTDEQGFCLIQKEELISINGLSTRVVSFTKKTLMVEIIGELVDELIKGKEVAVKSAKLIVVSVGKKYANLRTKAGSAIYDQVVLDELNKEKIRQLRKEM